MCDEHYLIVSVTSLCSRLFDASYMIIIGQLLDSAKQTLLKNV